jgi:ketosteroid isomerase-like protein
MPSTNEAKALAYLEYPKTRDMKGFRSLFADDLVFWIPPSAHARFGMPRPLVGVDAFIRLAGEGIDQIYRRDTIRWNRQHLSSDGNLVWLHASMTCTLVNGKAYDNDYLLLFRFEDGAIKEVWEFTDTAYFSDLMAARE